MSTTKRNALRLLVIVLLGALAWVTIREATYRHPLGNKFQDFRAVFPLFPGTTDAGGRPGQARQARGGYGIGRTRGFPFCPRYRATLFTELDLDVSGVMTPAGEQFAWGDNMNKIDEIARFYRDHLGRIGFSWLGGTGSSGRPNGYHYVAMNDEGVMVMDVSVFKREDKTILHLDVVISDTYTDSGGVAVP